MDVAKTIYIKHTTFYRTRTIDIQKKPNREIRKRTKHVSTLYIAKIIELRKTYSSAYGQNNI